MCGIAGFINFQGHDRKCAQARLKRMTDSLVHRGPDEEGFYIDDHAALGHRRLSIIDLAGGHQPMAIEDGGIQVVFNGEIYNYPALKKELVAKGYRFHTQSDTETLLYSYREWGEQCVDKLNGMFAFAIWDVKERSLFLARDRVGKKPLYYYWNGQVFSFASELKGLRVAGLCPTDIDPEAIDCYFSFGYIPAPKTIYKSVNKLLPAHTLTVREGSVSQRRYWAIHFARDCSRSVDDIVEQFETLFDDAVKCRLMADVPLGAFLSAGLDSTLVVSSMAKAMNRPVLTNSIGFGDPEFNELPLAGLVAEHFRTDHREYVVDPQINNVLEKIAWHFDEPFADSSAVPTWYVCEMAKNNVTVALSGDGGDENYGGYTFRYIPHVIESRIRSILPNSLFRRLLFGLPGRIYPAYAWLPRPLRLKTFLENLAGSDATAFYNDLIWLRQDTRQNLYTEDLLKGLGGFEPFEIVKPTYESSNAYDPLSRALYTDINLYMTDDCLVKVDRMSMAHSLEVRSPLLDYRLMEFAASLPSRLKIRYGKGKVLLRRLASDRLPAEILKQPKRGFSIPAARWLRHELRDMAEQAILNSNSFHGEFLKRNQLEATWKEHLSGNRDHSVFLWGLLMLDLWAKMHHGQQAQGPERGLTESIKVS